MMGFPGIVTHVREDTCLVLLELGASQTELIVSESVRMKQLGMGIAWGMDCWL